MPVDPNAESRSPPSPGCRRSPGAGPRPARPLGARGDRPATIGSACSTASGPPNICSSSRSARCPASGRQGPDFRDRRDRPIYRREERGAAAARPAGPRIRAIQWTYAALNSVEPAIHNLLLDRHVLHRRGMGEAAPAGRRGFRQAEAQASRPTGSATRNGSRATLHHRRPADGHRPALPAPHRIRG